MGYRSAGRIGHAATATATATAAGAAAGVGKKKKRVLTVGEMLNPVDRRPAALQGKGRCSSGLSGVWGKG